MDTVCALLIGIGVAAASGFRVFLPLFGLALAGRFGGVAVSGEFAWLLSDGALVALGTAMLAGIDEPVLKWGLALIAGGGAAGVVQAGSVLARAVSTASTGGLAIRWYRRWSGWGRWWSPCWRSWPRCSSSPDWPGWRCACGSAGRRRAARSAVVSRPFRGARLRGGIR